MRLRYCRKQYWKSVEMTKQLTEKQKDKIREANTLAKDCIEIIARMNQILDDMQKSDSL